VSERAPHVLHVVRTLGRSGGMERNLHRVVVATRARGVRHSIALLSDFPDVIDFGEHAEVHRVLSAPNDPRLILKLRRLLARLAPTVIHARNWGAWPDVALARQLVSPRPRLVFSYHGSEEVAAVPLKRRLAFRAAAALTDELFAVSDAARALLVEGYGLPAERIAVLPNGVDTTRFAPSLEPRTGAGPVTMGTVGRMHPVKNFPLLLEATARLVAEGLDVEVVLAGDGPLLAQFSGEAQRLGLGARARFLGHVEDVPAFLRTLDVFVLPSALEANPNALLEALAAGLPCVASAVGGIPEVTDQGRVALLFPAGDVATLTAHLRGLVRDLASRRRLGQEARGWIESRYGAEQMMSRYLALYLRSGRARAASTQAAGELR
jgi:glycosyltransferase involved in cell wall biosynthesis